MRTRMSGGVGAGRAILPATRFAPRPMSVLSTIQIASEHVTALAEARQAPTHATPRRGHQLNTKRQPDLRIAP